MATTPTGLCGSCAHQRVVGNTRGSSFSLCELAKVDQRFTKYPRLPVLACAGHAPRELQPPAAGTDSSKPPA